MLDKKQKKKLDWPIRWFFTYCVQYAEGQTGTLPAPQLYPRPGSYAHALASGAPRAVRDRPPSWHPGYPQLAGT
eukprot:313060-Rhodomonas_salina.1